MNASLKRQASHSDVSVETKKFKYEQLPKSHVIEYKGEREYMEDRHVCIDNFCQHLAFIAGLESASFYCVCDGHSGSQAAQYTVDVIHLRILENLRKLESKERDCIEMSVVEKSLKKVFVDSYKQVDAEFLRKCNNNKPPWKDGTTVSNILLLNRYLYAANVGDSRAVLFRYKTGESGSDGCLSSIDI